MVSGSERLLVYSQVSASMGPIRRFIDSNADLFELVKEGGAWVVKLLE